MSECAKGCGRKASRRGLCSSHYNTRRERDIAYGRWQSGYVDAEPARRHVLALRAAGMGKRRVAAISGVSLSVIHVLVNGRPERGTPPSKRISAANSGAILAVSMPEARNLAAGSRIDSTGTIRRLQAMSAIGYTQSDLCRRLGITPSNSTCLFRGHRSKVLASTALRVAALYDELSMTSGPSQAARGRAQRLGWSPPLAWDDEDINDPDATPDTGTHRMLSWDEKYQELRDLGLTDRDIMARWNIQPQSLIRQLSRYGIPKSAELERMMRERQQGIAS